MTDETRCELLLALGEAQGKAGDTPEAKETLLAAADLAPSPACRASRAGGASGYSGRFPWLAPGRTSRLIPLLEEALAGLGAEECAARSVYSHGSPERCVINLPARPRSSLSREAVAIARRLENADTLGYALVSLTTATWSPDIEELVPYVEEVKRLAEETGGVRAHA